jgi:betaine-homocysteine S-methyltransferase
LATVGLENSVEALNHAAVRIAREVAGDRCLVAGNLSLTWMYEEGSETSRSRVLALFDEQLENQVSEGIDFVIGETFSFLGEALLAVESAKKTKLPVMVTMCFENQDVTPEGKTAAECARALADAGADIVGINCLRSPEHTLPLIAEMRRATSAYIAAQPVAFRTTAANRDFTSLPAFPHQLEPFQLSRGEMADYALKARDMGVNYIGACCGAGAAHIREMARALGKIPADDRMWKTGGEKPMSAYEYYKHDQA